MYVKCIALLIGVATLTIVGCGPLHTPMPPRLDEETQAKVDVAWNDAFTPPDRLDRQALLDAFVETQAYQNGVDRLMLRSEKWLRQGLLVMEIHFDRLLPDNDRFEVTLYDQTNHVVRSERYSRVEIETAYADLFPAVPERGRLSSEPPEWEMKRTIAENRRAAVDKLLPKLEKDKTSR